MTALLSAEAGHLTREELEAAYHAFAQLAADHSDLLANVRASVAAADQGAVDPLLFIRHYLAAHGQLPPKGARPTQLLAKTTVPALLTRREVA
ncbi:hypothetical protein [Nonomuraea typhae]|uniref:hypothetical protein n=1 Tax=Nonomuraea typhae TaxID=2603600 RepID=UPI001FE7CFCB|nr:hypothetical protein [Nonomuraea typhae]